MEFDVVSRESNCRDLPADQVGWLLQQRISRPLKQFLFMELRVGTLEPPIIHNLHAKFPA
jgi:hypothetical protein